MLEEGRLMASGRGSLQWTGREAVAVIIRWLQ
jgi:hypothetical protein